MAKVQPGSLVFFRALAGEVIVNYEENYWLTGAGFIFPEFLIMVFNRNNSGGEKKKLKKRCDLRLAQ